MTTRVLIFASATLIAAFTLTGRAAPPAFNYLDPGGAPDLRESVGVNVVFVGYERPLIDETAFRRALPATYEPVVRSRLWYGIVEKLGIHYDFQYNVTFADATWENRFFGALGAMATPAPRTLFQNDYNAQARNVLDVGQNHFIDAPSVERWLIANAPAGVDTRRNTIFFINWWGRPDFRFHVYTKFGEPDPDTGYDFGVNRASRKIIAWGGTPPNDEESGTGTSEPHRVWFHDLSAGPESWTDNWNVDNADVDGDGVADYRMPAAWEYFTAGGYRAASALTGDLARIARYVAINQLFTTSPLYPPYITPNRQPASINLDLNTYEGWAGMDASRTFQDIATLLSEVSELHRIPYNSDQQDLALTGEALNCYQLWLNDSRCYPNRPYPGSANLFLYNALRLGATQDGGAEYEGMMFNYATNENRSAGILGFADDNWIDGTQSGVFNFVSPGINALGYGLTTTQIHEFGHHIGMSHPHDGWDSEQRLDYGPEGSTYFAWAGDESNSIMSYIDLNWDFSQFDRDNFNRFQAAAYIINSNAIAEDVLASPNSRFAMNYLHAADGAIGDAMEAFAAHDYVAAFDHAARGYRDVVAAAGRAGVAVEASANGWTVLPAVRGRGPNKKTYTHVDRYGPGTKRSAD